MPTPDSRFTQEFSSTKATTAVLEDVLVQVLNLQAAVLSVLSSKDLNWETSATCVFHETKNCQRIKDVTVPLHILTGQHVHYLGKSSILEVIS